jgi:hypothetical protein
MEAARLPDPAAESGHNLRALRHALADPLSAVALKLNLVERRLQSPSGADPAWILERVRAAQADLGAANRLLDVLLRLAEIAGERPDETTLGDICEAAGIPLQSASPVPPLPLRRRSSADAIREVASFATRGESVHSPVGRATLESGRVTLALEGTRVTADGRPDRLLDLPHGIDDADALFVARAAVQADGGSLELTENDGRLVATFSWPVAAAGRQVQP